MQGDAASAEISKAEEMGHPTTVCTLLPRLAASQGQAWGEGKRVEVLRRFLFEWVSSDFSRREQVARFRAQSLTFDLGFHFCCGFAVSLWTSLGGIFASSQ